MDRLALVCSAVRDPLPEDNPQAAAFLLAALELLTVLIARYAPCANTAMGQPFV